MEIPELEHSSFATTMRVAIAVGLLVVSAICGLWSTLIHWEIMEKVNSKLPDNERFQPLWWGPIKRQRLNAEYRRLFPNGGDLTRINRLFVIMIVALVGIAITLRFFS